ncbi:hypothetical protein TNCV_3391731 [Trichonephila clavipes]|nr:hypothetical protein TNCV_3391731 [Trichonephila clavipes]
MLSGETSSQETIHKVLGSIRFGGEEVMVYPGISIVGRTDFHIIQIAALAGLRYKDEVLRPIVLSYATAIGDDVMLIEDNC